MYVRIVRTFCTYNKSILGSTVGELNLCIYELHGNALFIVLLIELNIKIACRHNAGTLLEIFLAVLGNLPPHFDAKNIGRFFAGAIRSCGKNADYLLIVSDGLGFGILYKIPLDLCF